MALSIEIEIRKLKAARSEILLENEKKDPFPKTGEELVSEIQVLYMVLAFTSSTGVLTSWLNAYPNSVVVLTALIIVSALFLVYGLQKVVRCLRR